MRALAVALIAAALALGAGGCTIGPDDDGPGGARLTVTRDYGAESLRRFSVKTVPGGETVMRFLQRAADVDTRYGGRFVTAIDGVRSGSDGGRRKDWFYYVNGIEAEAGAAERELEVGDRVWWDHHDWTAVMRVPAVVGSFPEPFVHGSEGKRFPVRVDCAPGAQSACDEVADRLDRAGAIAGSTSIGASAGEGLLRLVVGEWGDVRRDAAARQIEQGPRVSGVFARMAARGGAYELELLDELARVEARVSTGAGLVAATRYQEQQPTWVVTGTDRAGLERAVRLLEERALRDRFAVATSGTRSVRLPVVAGGGGER